MVKKISACVFISGRGTNLKSIIMSSRDYNFPISVKLIITNIADAKGLKYAKKYNIPYKFFNYKNKIQFEKKCLLEIKKRKIKFLCLAGFMKVLSKNFIMNFKHKIVNIHPSLLPRFKGLNTHKRVLKNKEKFTGCTVHYVNSRLDAGKIIMQKKIKIKLNDNEHSLEKRVLKQENSLYPEAIRSIFR